LTDGSRHGPRRESGRDGRGIAEPWRKWRLEQGGLRRLGDALIDSRVLIPGHGNHEQLDGRVFEHLVERLVGTDAQGRRLLPGSLERSSADAVELELEGPHGWEIDVLTTTSQSDQDDLHSETDRIPGTRWPWSALRSNTGSPNHTRGGWGWSQRAFSRNAVKRGS